VSYRPDDDGLRQIAQSSGMKAATLAVAQRMAGNANSVGDSSYEAESATVTAGWRNERRAGAVVRESNPHWRDSRDRILLRVRDAMSVRGRR
jgi:hypothetical protein